MQPSEQPVFLSVQAKGWNDFKKGRADNSEIVPMGIDCPMRYFNNILCNFYKKLTFDYFQCKER